MSAKKPPPKATAKPGKAAAGRNLPLRQRGLYIRLQGEIRQLGNLLGGYGVLRRRGERPLALPIASFRAERSGERNLSLWKVAHRDSSPPPRNAASARNDVETFD